MKNSCYFCDFCDICRNLRGPFGISFSKIVNLVVSVILEIFLRGVLACNKNPCYFCDICGHFGVSFGFFFSKVVNLVKFVVLVIFAIFVRGVFRTKHTLVTNCINFSLK